MSKVVYQPLVENSHLIGADRDADFELLSEANIHAHISEEKSSKDAHEMRQVNGNFQLEVGIPLYNSRESRFLLRDGFFDGLI